MSSNRGMGNPVPWGKSVQCLKSPNLTSRIEWDITAIIGSAYGISPNRVLVIYVNADSLFQIPNWIKLNRNCIRFEVFSRFSQRVIFCKDANILVLSEKNMCPKTISHLSLNSIHLLPPDCRVSTLLSVRHQKGSCVISPVPFTLFSRIRAG